MYETLLLGYLRFATNFGQIIKNCPEGGAGCNTTLPEVKANEAFITGGLRLLFAVLGAMAVLYIIIAGFQYVSSQANPQEVEKARNTILYAVIGLVIAISAQVIIGLTISLL